MKNNNQPNKTKKKKITPLSVFAAALAVTAISVAVFSSNGDKRTTVSANAITATDSNGYAPAVLNANKDVVIKVSDISEKSNLLQIQFKRYHNGIICSKSK